MSELRKAAQQALEALEGFVYHGIGPNSGPALASLRAALAQPESEPVAWLPSAEWTACIKLPVTVHVRAQCPGETHISTREGITPVKPDDLIMRGVSGEEYPIGREIFERTYRLGDAPPQCKPLTDQEIIEAIKHISHNEMSAFAIARAIENVLKNASSEANKGTYDNP